MEDDPVGGQGDVVGVGRGADWLVGGGPDAPARQVFHVAVLPGGVGSSVGAPAGDGEVLVAAVTGAAVGEHHRVREPPQQRHPWLRGERSVELSHRRRLQIGVGERGLRAGGLRFLEHQPARDALVEEELRSAHQRIGVEAALPDLAAQGVGERTEAHAEVVGHEGLHHRARLAWIGPGVIQRISESVRPESAPAFQRPEVGERPCRLDHRRQRRGVRRDDQVGVESSLERQVRHPEGPVLVGPEAIADVIAALADAPGHRVARAVDDLAPDRSPVGLVEEGLGERAHQQEWHQVLEHRPAPGHQGGVPAARDSSRPRWNQWSTGTSSLAMAT